MENEENNEILCEIYIYSEGICPDFQVVDLTTGTTLEHKKVPQWFFTHTLEYLNKHVRFIDAFTPPRDHESHYELKYRDTFGFVIVVFYMDDDDDYDPIFNLIHYGHY